MFHDFFFLENKSEILYCMIEIPFATLRFVLHFILDVLHNGKGKIVPPIENPLLRNSATKLAEDIRKGKCKSKDVIRAYISRIQKVEPYINATADTCFEDALDKAKEVDDLLASGKYTKEQLYLEKPLLGVPITVKCLFHVKDLPCNGGSLLFSHLRATEDAHVVTALRKAGAIVIATTNAAELGLHMATVNRVYGSSCNPYDTNRITGGSSGGEAALIGAGASVLGLGNDLLGSLRIPAHLCGVFSHKPSKGLVSNYGTLPSEIPESSETLRDAEFDNFLCSGPMCRCAEDLITSMKVLAIDEEVRRRFDQPVDFKMVKIYYLTEIRSPFVIPVEKDIATALKNAVSYFEKQYNITPKEVKMPYLFDVNRCTLTVIGHQIGRLRKSLSQVLGINDIVEYFKFLVGKSKFCTSTLLMITAISSRLAYRKNQSAYYQKMFEEWVKEFSELLDKDAVLLMPTLPFTAPYLSESFPLMLSSCYVSLISVLGLPATHCPMGLDRQGLPRGIQVVGCQDNDPLTIACAVELERAFGGWTSQ